MTSTYRSRNVIGCNLTRLRKERWLKQWQIAEELKISRACYASYEEGRVDPAATIVWSLCEFYGITPNDIYGIVPEANILQADSKQNLQS